MRRKTISQCIYTARKTIKQHPEYSKGFLHWTFIIQKDRIVGYATNRTGFPYKELGFKDHCKQHSEVNAYKKCRSFLDNDKDFEVLNIRLSRNKRLKNSKPCHCCYGFLDSVGCKKIYFTLEDRVDTYEYNSN